MRPLSDIVKKLKTQNTESERELFEISLKILKAHDVDVKTEANLTVDFPETFLPTDKIQEMMFDLTLVNNSPPLMSREEFWQKWNPDLTDKQMEEKAQKIDESVAKSRQARNQMTPPGFPPKIAGGEEEEGEERE